MCGIAGIILKPGIDSREFNALEQVKEMSYQQNHRGQDGTGYAWIDDETNRMEEYRSEEIAGKTYEKLLSVFGKKPSSQAIGFNQYKTEGGLGVRNMQPAISSTSRGRSFAFITNGNIVNYQEEKDKLIKEGYDIITENEAEIFVKKIATKVQENSDWYKNSKYVIKAIKWAMEHFKGGFSSVLMMEGDLYAFVDPQGFHPLWYGEDEKCQVIASETVALDILRIPKELRIEIQPGQIFHLSSDGTRKIHDSKIELNLHHCIFEKIYFSRPDSILWTNGESPRKHIVKDFRELLGRLIARADIESGLTQRLDFVFGIPDSAVAMALGYAKEAKLGLNSLEVMSLIRNHFVGRTYIKDNQLNRDVSVREKFNPTPYIFEDKIVGLLDDSIVRGTTINQIISMIFGSGARGVHLRICSPPIRHSCYYGQAFKEPELAMTVHKEVKLLEEAIRLNIRVKHKITDPEFTLRYLSLDDLYGSVPAKEQYCFACFDGNYSVK